MKQGDDSIERFIITTCIRMKRKEPTDRGRSGSVKTEAASSSLHDSWTRWKDERGYASEKKVQNCMGVRSSRKHVSSRRRRRHQQPRHRTPNAGEPTREVEPPSKPCLTMFPFPVGFVSSQAKNRPQRPKLKLQPTLSSLTCIIGSTNAIKTGDTDADDSISELSNEDTSSSSEADMRIATSLSNKTVILLEDMAEKTIVEELPMEWKDPAKVQREQLQRELDELHEELAELQLLNCLDETELWLGLHDTALKSIRLDELYKDEEN